MTRTHLGPVLAWITLSLSLYVIGAGAIASIAEPFDDTASYMAEVWSVAAGSALGSQLVLATVAMVGALFFVLLMNMWCSTAEDRARMRLRWLQTSPVWPIWALCVVYSIPALPGFGLSTTAWWLEAPIFPALSIILPLVVFRAIALATDDPVERGLPG